jgi:hypothetical protein
LRGSTSWWRWLCEAFEALGLHFQIGFNVSVGRQWLGMTEPKRDDFQCDAGLEQAHGARMSERVAGNPAAIEGGTLHHGSTNRQSEAEGDAIAAQWFAASIGKYQLFGCDVVGFAPLTQPPLRPRPNRHHPVLSTFATKMDGMIEQVSRAKLQGFRNPCASVIEKGEEQLIALAGMSFGIGGGQYGVNLLSIHKPKHRFGRLLLWYRENPMTDTDELDANGLSEHKPHKRSDRRKPKVARACGVLASRLQVIKKGEDGRRGYRVKRQPVYRLARMPGEKR